MGVVTGALQFSAGGGHAMVPAEIPKTLVTRA